MYNKPSKMNKKMQSNTVIPTAIVNNTNTDRKGCRAKRVIKKIEDCNQLRNTKYRRTKNLVKKSVEISK